MTISDPSLSWAYWLALCLGGIGFGVFTASAFSQIIAKVHPGARASVSGLLPTAQQLGGTLGVTFAGMVYTTSAGNAEQALWHAMIYEAAAFALAAGSAVVLVGRGTRA